MKRGGIATRRSFARAMTRFGALVAFAAACLAGCGGAPSDQIKDIRGMLPDLEFHLTGHDGAVTAERFRGAPVLLYFGYASCPDVCPTTLAVLRAALAQLGDAGRAVRVLFVSVDPQRDTAAKLTAYAGVFGPQFVGLRGDDDALTRLTKRYRVGYSRGTPDARGDYPVTHSSAVFVFDANGAARYLVRSGNSSAAIAQMLEPLVETTRPGR